MKFLLIKIEYENTDEKHEARVLLSGYSGYGEAIPRKMEPIYTNRLLLDVAE